MDMAPDGCLAYKTLSLCLLFSAVEPNKRWKICEGKIKEYMIQPIFIQLEPASDMHLLPCPLPDSSDVEAVPNTNTDVRDFASVLQNLINPV